MQVNPINQNNVNFRGCTVKCDKIISKLKYGNDNTLIKIFHELVPCDKFTKNACSGTISNQFSKNTMIEASNSLLDSPPLRLLFSYKELPLNKNTVRKVEKNLVALIEKKLTGSENPTKIFNRLDKK